MHPQLPIQCCTWQSSLTVDSYVQSFQKAISEAQAMDPSEVVSLYASLAMRQLLPKQYFTWQISLHVHGVMKQLRVLQKKNKTWSLM